MKKQLTRYATTALLILASFCSSAYADMYSMDLYYDTSRRDDAARDTALMDEAQRTWESKPPHEHTLQDAYDHARATRQTNPKYLIRDSQRETQRNAALNSAQQASQNNPLYLNKDAYVADQLEQKRDIGYNGQADTVSQQAAPKFLDRDAIRASRMQQHQGRLTK